MSLTMKLIPPGSPVKTKQGREGMITHIHIDASRQVHYVFQPKGLNQITRKPFKADWLAIDLIDPATYELDELEVPIDVLGTQAMDNASEFSGTVTAICMHINGCVHIDIKSPETRKKSGEAVGSCNFNILQCSGEAIALLTAEELKAEREANPGPEPVPGGMFGSFRP